MVSKLDICNLALAQLGQEPISSLEQDDERARRCRLFYDPIRKEVLRTHNWSFACTQANLALLDEQIAGGKPQYIYAYPQNCLFMRKVYGVDGQQKVPFQEMYRQDLQMRIISCGVPQARAEYTRDLSDTTQFDPAFVKAFSLALAADLAMTLSADMSLAQQILHKYTLALDEARRSNMSENFEIHQSESIFVEQR